MIVWYQIALPDAGAVECSHHVGGVCCLSGVCCKEEK